MSLINSSLRDSSNINEEEFDSINIIKTSPKKLLLKDVTDKNNPPTRKPFLLGVDFKFETKRRLKFTVLSYDFPSKLKENREILVFEKSF